MLKKLGSDEGMIDAARREEDNLLLARYDGEEVGHAEGLAEGIEQTTKEMIKRLAENGVSIEMIAKSSKKSVSELEEILKNDA